MPEESQWFLYVCGSPQGCFFRASPQPRFAFPVLFVSFVCGDCSSCPSGSSWVTLIAVWMIQPRVLHPLSPRSTPSCALPSPIVLLAHLCCSGNFALHCRRSTWERSSTKCLYFWDCLGLTGTERGGGPKNAGKMDRFAPKGEGACKFSGRH